MTWTYDQSTGNLSNPQGVIVGAGYSGCGAGLNNPQLESIPDVGPIPQGFWGISPPFTDPEKGPIVMRLSPDASTETYGRSGFLIHGDNPQMNHSASEGCIILSHELRQAIAASGDRTLVVT